MKYLEVRISQKQVLRQVWKHKRIKAGNLCYKNSEASIDSEDSLSPWFDKQCELTRTGRIVTFQLVSSQTFLKGIVLVTLMSLSIIYVSIFL